MGNAVKQSNQASQASQLADMLSRMNAGKPASESGSGGFARVMSQHQADQSGDQSGSLAAQLAEASSGRPGSMAAPLRSPVAQVASPLGAARLQAAKAQQKMALASQSPEARALKARAEQAPKQEAKQEAKPAKSADAAQAADKAKGAQAHAKADAPAEDHAEASIRFATAMGEGSAEVRELTPPAEVKANDAASMMAWLVSLTQPDAAVSGALDGGVLAEEGGLPQDALVGEVRDDGRDDKGRGRGLAMGWGLGQREVGQDARSAAASSTAALQVEAMLGRGAAGLSQDSDALAAMVPADGARASFGQTLSQLTAPRHEQASIPVPLNAPDFAQKLADQVSMWVGQVKQEGPMTAELHLNPAEMGPINVKISLDGNAAQVDFAAAALETRQAIEASLSALSSALGDVGLSLSGSGVSSQTPERNLSQGGHSGEGGQRSLGGEGRAAQGDVGADDALAMHQVSAPKTSRLGGLDLYA